MPSQTIVVTDRDFWCLILCATESPPNSSACAQPELDPLDALPCAREPRRSVCRLTGEVRQ